MTEEEKQKIEEEKKDLEVKSKVEKTVAEKPKETQKVEDKTSEKTKPEVKKKEVKAEAKDKPKETQKTKKKDKKIIVKKDEAVAFGKNLHISKKQGVYICSFVKNKKIDAAITDLEQVIKMKKAVPFKGEIPHRKGKIMSGRYPVKASAIFINILKGLKGNVLVNGMDLDKSKIYFASASWASRPAKSRRRSAKRTNLILKAKEIKMGAKN